MGGDIGFIRRTNVIVTPGTNTNLGDLAAGTSLLRVTVSATSLGMPQVAGATVKIRPSGLILSEMELESLTDALGICSLGNLTPGNYRLTVYAPGLAARQQTVTVSGALTDVSLDLVAGRIVRGTIQDETGTPMVEIVRAVNQAGDLALTTYSGADGSYLMDFLPLDVFNVWVAYPELSPFVAQNINTNNASPQWVNATLVSSGAVLTGRVTNNAGNPLANIPVSLVDSQGSPVTTRFTDFNGGYLLGPLPAGTFSINAGGMGFESVTAAVTMPSSGTLTRDFVLGQALAIPARVASILSFMGDVPTGLVVGLFWDASTIGVPRPTYPFDPARLNDFVVIPDRYCESWKRAYDRCVKSKAIVNQAFENWDYSWKALSQFVAAEIALALSKGAKIGAEATLALSSLLKQQLVLPAKQMSAMADLAYKYGKGSAEYLEALDQLRDLYGTLGSIVSTAITSTAEAKQKANGGNFNGLDLAIQNIKPLVLQLADKALLERFPKLKGLPGVLGPINDIYSMVKGFFEFADEIEQNG